MGITSPRAGATKCGWGTPSNMDGSPGARITRPLVTFPRSTPSPLRRTGGQDVTGWPATIPTPKLKLVRHLKSTLIWTGVHVDEAVMGLSVHTDEDGGGNNPLLNLRTSFVSAVEAPQTTNPRC